MNRYRAWIILIAVAVVFNASCVESKNDAEDEGVSSVLPSASPQIREALDRITSENFGLPPDRIDFDGRGYVLYLTLPPGSPDAEVRANDMTEDIASMMMLRPDSARCRVMVRDDGRDSYLPVGRFFAPASPAPKKPAEDTGKGGPADFGSPQRTGFLSGKSIFLSPGHGWYYNDDSAAWLTQRGNTNGIVEDFSNAESVLQFLVPYLHNAGANVYTVRERDMNTQMAVTDDADASASYTGSWSASTSTSGYYGAGYKVALVSTTETATATFAADIVEDGFYHVYLWYTGGSNRSQDARITVRHADGDVILTQNLRRDGFTWKDLGRYYFRADDDPEHRCVVLSNEGSDTATYVIADAVRFGGGIDEDALEPRFEMSGLYYAPFMGCPECVTNTVTTMPRLAAWESESWEDSLYISWHTNAPDPGTGTSSFAYASGGWDETFDGVEGGLELRDAIHEEIIADLRTGYDASWPDRGTHTNWYGEINPNYNAEMPGALFEMAFHDTPSDAEDIKQPEFRRIVARAVYQGAARYFADRDGTDPAFLPEPPEAPFAVMTDDGVALSWSAPFYDGGGIAGDPAEGYRVYTGITGKGFVLDQETADESALVPTQDASVAFYRVGAFNDGGESFPTETLAVSTGDALRVLIVNGFDRLDKSSNVPEDYYGGGTIYRGYLERMNTFDYVIAHARALAAAGLDFDAASNEAVVEGSVDLSDYPAVVWVVGEESTANDSIDADEQALISAYLDAGGALFVSGSEIGWDLWEYGSADDQAFYTDYLRAQYVADSSGTGQVSASGIFAGVSPFDFDFEDYIIYAANYPDAISALSGGSTDLAYVGTSYGAAVADASAGFRVVHLGFPFETIYDETARDDLMDAAMNFLLAGTSTTTTVPTSTTTSTQPADDDSTDDTTPDDTADDTSPDDSSDDTDDDADDTGEDIDDDAADDAADDASDDDSLPYGGSGGSDDDDSSGCCG